MGDNKGSYNHILKYTGIFGGIQVINILFALIRNKFVALILGPEGMGLVSLFNSTIKLVSDSTNFGIQISAVKNISEAFSKNDSREVERNIVIVRSWSILVALLGMLVCMLAGPLVDNVAFSWGDHTLHFVLLSPIVGMMAITGGETAILKGTQQLRGLAAVSSLNIFLALITTVPMYYVWGEMAIIPSLVVVAVIQMLLTIRHSLRFYPLKFDFSKETLGKGAGMIKLGIAFVSAGIMGSGVDFGIRSLLNNYGALDTVGLYNAGYVMTLTYAGMVFSAMESDYFPRLSAITCDTAARNIAINNQIEVLLLLISPMIVAFIVFMPIIVPLLLSSKFVSSIGMMQIMALSLYCRAVVLPMQYLPLSRGDSRSYLLLEAVYDVLLFIATALLYDRCGLTGAGAAVTVVGIIDVLFTIFYLRIRYSYVFSNRIVKFLLVQTPLGVCAFALTFFSQGWLYWVAGALMFFVSLLFSLFVIRRNTGLWEIVSGKLLNRFKPQTKKKHGKG
ncbi:MAG: oligosaccharide flippase family protein [Prevotella sp.]|uniref:oligosaccharide flippase family protein n=1 Tax=Prevotella sp. TaxID=59823 RepID=UPI002A30C226|nr:oligosaccharide flippase family protein [Prevotella sp.]MDD7319228.1 oligosaccharide flippase family protein [Prevotellaceae bacterium]MDY4020147.1 oligosaccharide flippase family protein [Prevotella sp.]